jgi:CHAT domain
MKDKTILFIAANPKEGKTINWQKEFKIIKRIIKKNLSLKDYCRMELEPDATSEDFLECLESDNPWIIHFAGHGLNKSGEIVLVNENNSMKPINTDALVDVLKYCKGLECIVFSSCYSSAIIEKTQKAVKYSIGFKGSIDTNQSIEFAKEFYKNLDLNEIESIHHAFQRTKTYMRFNQQDDFEPILKSRKNFIFNEIISNQRKKLIEELTPAGLDELEYIEKQIKLNKIDISRLENESFILKQDLDSINTNLNIEQKKYLEKHEFALEILWFIKNRQDISFKLANIIFPFESNQRVNYFAKELNIIFNYLEAALVLDDYTDLLEEDLTFENLEFDISFYKTAFGYLDKIFIKEIGASNDFILYLKDNISYFENIIK